MADDNDGGTWWEHALNAIVAGYDAHSQKRDAAQQQREAEIEARRRARAKAPTRIGRFGEVPRRKVKPDEPCCTGPRQK